MPQARYTWEITDHRLHIVAESFVWQLRINAPRSIKLSDNHFDLLPGQERVVLLEGPEEAWASVHIEHLP